MWLQKEELRNNFLGETKQNKIGGGAASRPPITQQPGLEDAYDVTCF